MSRVTPASQRKLTCRQAAERLGISTETLRTWAKAGKIPFERDASGRNRVYAPADVDALLDQFAQAAS